MHRDLKHYANVGNMLMVRHLIHIGVPVQQSLRDVESPLVMACRGWHNDIVDLLLEHGADPNFAPQKIYPVFPLHEAATSSNLRLARKLLDLGALPNRHGEAPTRYPALYWAFAREHPEMIRLLLERGATFSGLLDPTRRGWIGIYLAEMTGKLGYESMAEMLREHGYP